MTVEQFEKNLRQFIRQEPFKPFVVEFADGRILEIDHPKVVFAGGAASFLTPDYDLVEFYCEDVSAMRPAVPGLAQ